MASEEPRQKYSTAVRLAFSLARYRVLQRTVMVTHLFHVLVYRDFFKM